MPIVSLIRPATLDDVPQLVAMLQRFNHDWDYVGKRDIDKEYAFDYFSSFVKQENTITAIAEQRGEVAGTFGGCLIYNPFNKIPTLYKSFWYAKPEYPGAGRELLQFAKSVAVANDAEQFFIGSMHPRVSKLLEREGFTPQETLYLMEF